MEIGFVKLATMPTVVGDKHESLYQSYHVLLLVTDLLERGVPGDVVLAIINEIRVFGSEA